MKLSRQAVFLALALAGVGMAGSTLAQVATDELPAVAVKGMKKPELKSYRAMLAGLDAFEQQHRLAPAATELRFLLTPVRDAESGPASLTGLTLRIAGTATSIAVPLAADGSFTLPRYQQAIDEDADLILNRKAKLFGWSPEVRSTGVPAGMRRLGDLRLECEVGVAIARQEMGFVRLAAASVFLMGKPPCAYKKYSAWGFSAPQPIQSATLISGQRRVALPFHGVDYLAPLPDQAWPDDALIEFQYLAPPAPPAPVMPPSATPPSDPATPSVPETPTTPTVSQ